MPINTFKYVEHYPNNIRVDLIDVSLNKDGMGYYLSPRYRVENDTCVKEIYIPKARLKINFHQVGVDLDTFKNNYMCNLGFGNLELYADDDGHVYYEIIKEEKIHDMTLEEIEKRLGYKVRIITKET